MARFGGLFLVRAIKKCLTRFQGLLYDGFSVTEKRPEPDMLTYWKKNPDQFAVDMLATLMVVVQIIATYA